MKKLIAYYEPHVSGGYVVECYVEGHWECIFRHEGGFETLYAECERRAAIRKGRLEALIQGLPALEQVTEVKQVCVSPRHSEVPQQAEFALFTGMSLQF
jgi:hypothetical protein